MMSFNEYLELDFRTFQTLEYACKRIEASKQLQRIEASAWPNMNEDVRNKMLDRLCDIANGKKEHKDPYESGRKALYAMLPRKKK
jgi:hypothetical protein